MFSGYLTPCHAAALYEHGCLCQAVVESRHFASDDACTFSCLSITLHLYLDLFPRQHDDLSYELSICSAKDIVLFFCGKKCSFQGTLRRGKKNNNTKIVVMLN